MEYYARVFKKHKVFVFMRIGLSNIILQETFSVLNSRICLAKLISFLFLFICNCFMR